MKPSSPPAAVVFDMDGVLIDSERAWRQAEDQYLSRIAPRYTPADHHLVIGIRLKDLHRLLVDRFGAVVQWNDFHQHYETVGEDIYGHRTQLMPSVVETLQNLKAKNIALGLASSSPNTWIQTTLNRFSLQDYFDFVVSGDEVTHGKPAPDIYRAAAAGLGQRPKNCWAVEDTDVGLQSARQAGLIAIGYRNGDNEHQTFSEVSWTIHNLIELSDTSETT